MSFDHTSVHPVFSAPGSVWTCLGTLAPKNINIHQYPLLTFALALISRISRKRFTVRSASIRFFLVHTHITSHTCTNFRLVSLSFILDIIGNKAKEWWALEKWYDIPFIRGSVGWMTSKSDWPQQGARTKDAKKLWSTKCHKSWWTRANSS